MKDELKTDVKNKNTPQKVYIMSREARRADAKRIIAIIDWMYNRQSTSAAGGVFLSKKEIQPYISDDDVNLGTEEHIPLILDRMRDDYKGLLRQLDEIDQVMEEMRNCPPAPFRPLGSEPMVDRFKLTSRIVDDAKDREEGLAHLMVMLNPGWSFDDEIWKSLPDWQKRSFNYLLNNCFIVKVDEGMPEE